MVASVLSVAAEDNRKFWWWNLSLDDQIWLQTINSYRYVEKRWRNHDMTDDESVLFKLLHRGFTDATTEDRPFPMATRSMRFSSCVAERLWGLIDRDRKQVHLRRCSRLLTTPLKCSQIDRVEADHHDTKRKVAAAEEGVRLLREAAGLTNQLGTTSANLQRNYVDAEVAKLRAEMLVMHNTMVARDEYVDKELDNHQDRLNRQRQDLET